MAYLTIECNVTDVTIGTLNDVCQKGERHNAINGIIDLISALASGNHTGTVKVVVKDAASTINTSGAGSTSQTY